MKKVYSCSGYGIVFLLVSIMLSPLLIATLATCVQCIFKGVWDTALAAAIGCVVFSLLLLFFIFAANRMLYVVWIENGIIKRKALLGGLYKELNICDIQEVVLFRPYKENVRICLIDNSEYAFDGARRDSYIQFPYTASNIQFLRTFWDGDIKELTW